MLPGRVREHPAPSGALRLLMLFILRFLPCCVREHPAPSGALRHHVARVGEVVAGVREHPAPSGALRL